MNEILEARWQDGKQGRGFWMCGCMSCTQVIAEVKINHREKSRMCGHLNAVTVALVLPLGVDLRSGKRPYQLGENTFKPGSHFAKTARHARRLTHGRSERLLFSVRLDESTRWEPGIKEREIKVINPRAAKYARENLQAIRRQRNPESPIFVTPDALPITILCPRDGCNRISVIRNIAAGAMARRVERAQYKSERHSDWMLGDDKSNDESEENKTICSQTETSV
jgi:hypothetical protein